MFDKMLKLLVVAAVLILAMGVSAFADDWIAVKLRGQVMQYTDGMWAELNRGDVIPDNRVIRTLASGHVVLQRNNEIISLGANTQVQINDKSGQRFTTVKQSYGTVEIQAEARQVQHFAVETPFLAAVVKGTRFVVKSGKTSASVKVTRGRVETTALATGAHALILAGQTATVTAQGDFGVKGRNANKTVIVNADGQVIAAAAISTAGGLRTAAGSGGINAAVNLGDQVTVDAGAGDEGIGIDIGAGDANVEVGVGGGEGVSVNVGGVGVSVGGGLF